MKIENGILVGIKNSDINKYGHFQAPESVVAIADDVFKNKSQLKSASFPGVTSVGQRSFWNCKNLTAVSLPEVTSVDSGAFASCVNLIVILLPKARTVAEGVLSNCWRLKEVLLPELTSVGSQTFQTCTSLKDVLLPELTSVDYHSFLFCTGLTMISLPKAASVEQSSFFCCENLTAIMFSGNLTYINECAFNGCAKLKYIVIETESADDMDRIKGLLPEVLREKVIKKSDYDKGIRWCAQITNQQLRRVMNRPRGNPLQFFAPNQADYLGEDLLVQMNHYLLPKLKHYQELKGKLFELRIPSSESDFQSYQATAKQIVDEYIQTREDVYRKLPEATPEVRCL